MKLKRGIHHGAYKVKPNARTQARQVPFMRGNNVNAPLSYAG